MNGLKELQSKDGDLTTKHNERIIIIEERLVVAANFQSSVNLINNCDKELALLKKEVEGILKEKQEQKDAAKKPLDGSARVC